MKFVLKVLALVFLVVMSKLAKDESIETPATVAAKTNATQIFTSNIQKTPIKVKQPSVTSVKFETSALQVN